MLRRRDWGRPSWYCDDEARELVSKAASDAELSIRKAAEHYLGILEGNSETKEWIDRNPPDGDPHP